MKRGFAELTPVEALQAAISIERRNTEIYQNLAQTFASYDRSLGELFGSMAEEEVNHRLALEDYLRQQFPGEQPSQRLDPGIREVVEAPDLEEPEVFIFDNVTVDQAIDMAERAETEACDFYQAMARQVTDAGLKRLCQHMAEVEAEHRGTFVRWKQSRASAQDLQAPKGGSL